MCVYIPLGPFVFALYAYLKMQFYSLSLQRLADFVVTSWSEQFDVICSPFIHHHDNIFVFFIHAVNVDDSDILPEFQREARYLGLIF